MSTPTVPTITRRLSTTTDARCSLCPGVMILWVDRALHLAWHAKQDAPTPAPTPAPVPAPTPAPTPAPKPNPGRKVLALFMPTPFLGIGADYWDQYLDPNGEGGKHRSSGGFVRDKPLAPGTGATARATDLTNAITDARAAGIDGFLPCIMGIYDQHWNWANVVALTEACTAAGFSFVPLLDVASMDPAASADPAKVGAALATLPLGGWLTEDGELLLSSFTAELKPPSWWATVVATLKAATGKGVRLQVVFQDDSPANMDAYASVAYCFGRWGDPAPDAERRWADSAKNAHDRGKKWMHPIRHQDVRPYAGVYAEARNTELLRVGYDRAIGGGADYLQVVTWNDYSESSHVAPSVGHGRALEPLLRFYNDWWRTGAKPTVTEDVVVLTHRTQPYAALGSLTGVAAMRPVLGGGGQPRDLVEALCVLAKTAAVSVNGGPAVTVQAQTPTVVTAALRVGQQTVTVDGKTTTSPHVVTDKPVVQDLSYKAALA